MTEDKKDDLRFKYMPATIMILVGLGLALAGLNWVDQNRALSETNRLRANFCGKIPGPIADELRRLTSKEEYPPTVLRNLRGMVERWVESTDADSFRIRVFREEGDNWKESTWQDDVQAVYEPKASALLTESDCGAEYDGQKVRVARRHRGPGTLNIVLVAERDRK